MQTLYLATTRFSALIRWQLMLLSIGETLTRRLVELMKQYRTMYMQSRSDQLWLRPTQIWLRHIKTGVVPLFVTLFSTCAFSEIDSLCNCDIQLQ